MAGLLLLMAIPGAFHPVFGASTPKPNGPSAAETPNSSTLNVKTFGAKGDGIANDTAAVEAAIREASRKSGTVYFPAGTYLVANARLLGNVTIKGAGEKSILKLPDKTAVAPNRDQPGCILTNAKDHLEFADGRQRMKDPNNSRYLVRNITITDLSFDGNKVHNDEEGIHGNSAALGGSIGLFNARNVVIERCRFLNSRLDGIHIGYSEQGGTDDSVVRDCYFEGNDRCGIAQVTGKNNLFERNLFKRTGKAIAIDIEANLDGEVNSGHRILNNRIEGVVQLASRLFPDQRNLLVEGNIIMGNASGGIMVDPDVCPGSIIRNNKVVGQGIGSGIGLRLSRGNDHAPVEIVGNTVTNFVTGIGWQSTLSVGGSGRIHAKGNTIRDCRWGVFLSRPGPSVIEDNTFENIGHAAQGGSVVRLFFAQTSVMRGQGGIVVRGNAYTGDTRLSHFIEQNVGGQWKLTEMSPRPLLVDKNRFTGSLGGDSASLFHFALPTDVTGNVLKRSGPTPAPVFTEEAHVGTPANCRWIGNTLEGWSDLSAGTTSTVGWTVQGNTLRNFMQAGIVLKRPARCVVQENRVEDAPVGIRLEYGSTRAGLGGNVIRDNTILARRPQNRSFNVEFGERYAPAHVAKDIFTGNQAVGTFKNPALTLSAPSGYAPDFSRNSFSITTKDTASNGK